MTPPDRKDTRTTTVWLDLETYSDRPVKYGPYFYSETEELDIVVMAYGIDYDPVQWTTNEDQIRNLLLQWFTDPHTVLVAHNAQFERVILSRWLQARCHVYDFDRLTLGSDFLPPSRFRDTMALAALTGRPRGLGAWAESLGIDGKDEAGTALINWFSKPTKAGTRRLLKDHQEKAEAFVRYCVQDVNTMRSCALFEDKYLPLELPDGEQRIWETDQRIQDRGLLMDLPLAQAAVARDQQIVKQFNQQIQMWTGVDNPNSLAQLNEWGADRSGWPSSLDAASRAAALQDPVLDPIAQEVIALRSEVAESAVKKWQVIAERTDPLTRRLRGTLQYGGAHTMRWAGRNLQPQNMPRDSFKNEDDEYDEGLEAAARERIMNGTGDRRDLKALLRPSILGPLVVADYSQIESRVLNWVAGESWALDAFEAGRDIYVETARMADGGTGVMDRQAGKQMVLGCGYGAGLKGLLNMGARRLGDDEYLQHLVQAWRSASPNVVSFWKELETTWIHGGVIKRDQAPRIQINSLGNDRQMILPSGRSLWYRDVQLREGRWPDGGTKWEWTFHHPTDKRNPRSAVWGGSLTENLVQAIARDVLACALTTLDALDHRVVSTVHDEVIIEQDVDFPETVEDVCQLITDVPWARRPGEGVRPLPLAAAGYIAPRYRKE